MSDYLRTGSANDTWYVNTSYTTTAIITPADTVIDTESEWENATIYPWNTSWVPKASGSMESNTVTGFTPSKTYSFVIRARDEGGNIGGISNNAIATAGIDSTPPSAITDLIVETGLDHGSVWLNWTAPGDDGVTGTVDNYIVKYSTLPIPNKVCFDFIERDYIININGNISGGGFESRVISALPAGETFYFSIIAEDEAGNEGNISNCPPPVQVQNDITPPAAISDLTVTTGLQHREVNLTWTAPGDDGMVGTSIYYWIKYSTSPITTQAEFDAALAVSESPTPQTSWSTENFVLKNTLTAGLTYYFAIEALDEAGNSGVLSTGPSVSAIAKDDMTAPDQITDLNAVPGADHATVRLFWNATGDDAGSGTATKYIVKYNTVDDFASAPTYSQTVVNNWTPKESGQAEDYTLESVMGGFISPNTLYYFWIQAVDDGNNAGAASPSASATTPEDTTPPEAINDHMAYTGDDHGDIILTWTAPHEDGGIGGACKQYLIKHSSTPITNDVEFNAATPYPIDITPKTPGSIEMYTLAFSPGSTQYFGIKALDEGYNFGPLSNVPVSAASCNDTSPPAVITDLSAMTADNNGEITLEWTAPGDDGATGTASQYIVKYREAFSEYLHVPYEKNLSFEDVWYNVTGIASASGLYRLGIHPDPNLAYVNSYPNPPVMSNYSRVLLVDYTTAGVYDTVYVDLDYDQDFSDEKPCFKGDEIAWADADDDGLADISGGMIYFISDGINHIPYSDVMSSKYGIDNIIPGNGELVCFTGEFNENDNHGTLCASAISAQGRIMDGLVVGIAPQSKLITVSNFYQAYSVFDCLDFTVEGYDGMPGTGDEAQVVSNSYGWTYDNDGWDFTSRYMDDLITQYAQGLTSFTVASMEEGSGYGTLFSPTAAPSAITCGAATSKLYRVDPWMNYDGG
ncbi:MAG: hypothetical protein KAX31_02620, partial [Thermoplasmata archaeon]|nr:hypothetical protein [Thermoplasmata archaeon]